MKRLLLSIIIISLIGAPASAQDAPGWQGLLGDLPAKEKAGFGGLCGMVVDPDNGTLWINISDRGFYRCDDQGKTFRRCSGEQPKGRTESPGCLMLDPTGKSKRMMTALVYGSPIALSDNGGQSWKYLHDKSSHVDWFAADWTAADPKFVLALKHEAGELLLASRDGGASFQEVGKGYGTGWVFDAKIAVVAEAKTKKKPKPSLMRTIDGGVSWEPCGAYCPIGWQSAQALPRWREGTLYWLTESGLIASSDRGVTWKILSKPKEPRYGPVFGKDANQMFVLSGAGIVESNDGGATWSAPIPPPKGLKGTAGLTWLAYDAKNDLLYLMKMGSDLYRLDRKTMTRP